MRLKPNAPRLITVVIALILGVIGFVFLWPVEPLLKLLRSPGLDVGILVETVWTDSPKWVSVLVYLAVGWIGAIAFPAIIAQAGVGAGALIAAGGILYTAGAVIYAIQRPDPRPAVFGYHEIFHVLVIAAALLQFAAIAFYVLPES